MAEPLVQWEPVKKNSRIYFIHVFFEVASKHTMNVSPGFPENFHISSAIKQKGKSQNGCYKKKSFRKINIFYPLISTRISGGKKCSFFEKFGVLCFLVTPVLRLVLLPYCRRYKFFVKSFTWYHYTLRFDWQSALREISYLRTRWMRAEYVTSSLKDHDSIAQIAPKSM